MAASAPDVADARGGDAEEHPDDRPDRLRQDRDRAPPRQARRAPFLKVEATKFTEVGYVGRDVEQIVRDLIEVAIGLVKSRKRKDIEAKAELAAEERVLDALVGSTSSSATREAFRRKLHAGELNDKEIEVELPQSGSGLPMFELPNMPALRSARSTSPTFSAKGSAPRPNA